MQKIYKSSAERPLARQTARQLGQYLRQPLPRRRLATIAQGSLALLTPLAAMAQQPCVYEYHPYTWQYATILLDIDGDGLATFGLANPSFHKQWIIRLNGNAGDPDGPANAGIDAVSIGGFDYVVPNGAGTTYVDFAFLNWVHPPTGNGPDPLAGGGTFNVVDANGVTVSINITIGGPTNIVTVNTVGGVAPVVCSSLPLDLSPQPVELVGLSIEPKEKSLQLNWTTATESNNQGFEIERSTDGLHFHKVGWVKGEGNSTKEIAYTFEDKSIKTNVAYYYRLKQVDLDGKSTNSGIVHGMIKGDVAIQFGELFPNPVHNATMQIEVVSKEENALTYTLYDQLGKVVLQGNKDLQAGTNNLRISTQGLANGNYYLKMQVGEKMAYKKVAIQK